MDPREKKVALRAITSGLFVMTSTDGDEFAAGGVNWLTQVSFEPPLLADDQLEVAKAFFRSTSVEGDLLNGHRFERGVATGAPILDEVPYWFEARVADTVARGDHTVYVAEVIGAGVRDASRAPLNLRTTGMNYGG